MRVLVQGRAPEAAREDSNGVEDETRADFDQSGELLAVAEGLGFLLLGGLGSRHLVDDLIVPHPDLVVCQGELHDPVDEGFALGMAPWGPECVCQERSEHLSVRRLIEGGVEGEQRTRSEHGVSGHAQLVHGVDV